MKPEVAKEFLSFLKSEKAETPVSLSKGILTSIETKLNPPLKQVLFKFFIAQFFAGVLSLAVCPQFGIGPIGGGHGLAHYFMNFGSVVCAAFCGAFFLGVSFFCAAWVLNKDEFRKILQYRVWIVTVGGGVYFVAMMLLGKALNLPSMFSDVYTLSLWIVAGWGSAMALLGLEKKFRLGAI